MKKLFLAVAVTSFFCVSACGVQNGVDAPPPVPAASDSAHLQLKSGSGYQQLPLSDVVSVDLSAEIGVVPTVSFAVRHFDDASKIALVLADLGLNAPTEPGFPAAFLTGTVTLRLRSGEIRHFDILNERMLQNHDHHESLFNPKKVLNPAWVAGFGP